MKRRRARFDVGQLTFSFNKMKRTWTNHWAVLALAFVALLFFGRAALRVYESKQESAAAAFEAQEKLEQLRERKQFLTESLERLSTQAGQEAELRRKFGVARPDESVAIIVATDTPATSPTSSVWDRLKNFWEGVWE